jgi:hypothetical protein
MVDPLAPWPVMVTPVWLRTPCGSGGVPDPRSATRSSSSATWAANDRAMTSSADGSLSSNSSTDSFTSRTSVRAVKVTESKVMSASVMAAFSAFHAGVPSPVSRASLSVCAVMGTVMAPAWNTLVWLRARSMTRLDSGTGTRWPPAVSVPSDSARSATAPSQLPVTSPRR